MQVFGKNRNKVHRVVMIGEKLEQIEIRATLLYRGKLFILFQRLSEIESNNFNLVNVIIDAQEIISVHNNLEISEKLEDLAMAVWRVTKTNCYVHEHFVWLDDKRELCREKSLLMNNGEQVVPSWKKAVDMILLILLGGGF